MTVFQKVKIKDVGRVVTGKTPPTAMLGFFNGSFPFITPSDIPDYKVRRPNRVERTLTDAWGNKAKNYLLPPNSICYVCIGSTVGKSCMTDQESFSNQQINSIICDKEKANTHFLFYYLKNKLKEIKTIADSSGAGKGIINKTTFEGLELLIPDLPTQTRIASVLSAYDDLIENNEKRIKALEEMAQLLYTEWFVKFKFPGHENVKMVDSGTEYGMIPEGWEVKKIKDIANVISGYAFKSPDFIEAGIPVIKIKNITSNNTVDIASTDFVSPELLIEKLSKYLLRDGDIVIAMTGATAGKIGRISTNKVMILNQRVAKIDPISRYYSFVWGSIETEEAQREFYNLAGGAAQPNMSATQIEGVKILAPTMDLLVKYENIALDYLKSISQLQKSNSVLAKMRDLLIPQLVTGKRILK